MFDHMTDEELLAFQSQQYDRAKAGSEVAGEVVQLAENELQARAERVLASVFQMQHTDQWS
jgi:hypothetical protein